MTRMEEHLAGNYERFPIEDCSSQDQSAAIGSILDDNADDDGFLISCIQLVDLAGSERLNLSSSTGQHMQESNYINKSLLGLGNVISRLADMAISSTALATSGVVLYLFSSIHLFIHSLSLSLLFS